MFKYVHVFLFNKKNKSIVYMFVLFEISVWIQSTLVDLYYFSWDLSFTYRA